LFGKVPRTGYITTETNSFSIQTSLSSDNKTLANALIDNLGSFQLQLNNALNNQLVVELSKSQITTQNGGSGGSGSSDSLKSSNNGKFWFSWPLWAQAAVIIGLAILVVIIFTVFYRRNQKTKQLQEQQERQLKRANLELNKLEAQTDIEIGSPQTDIEIGSPQTTDTRPMNTIDPQRQASIVQANEDDSSSDDDAQEPPPGRVPPPPPLPAYSS